MNRESTFRENIKLIIVRRFINEAKANIYAAFLREEGVQCFISNSTTGTLLPFANGGYLLHIAERDLEETNEILTILDQNDATHVDQDYRNADLADIAYEKAIYDHDKRNEKGSGRYLAILLIVLALIASAFFAFVRGSKSHSHTIGMNSMTIKYSPLHPDVL